MPSPQHAMALELLEAHTRPGMNVLDVGCGEWRGWPGSNASLQGMVSGRCVAAALTRVGVPRRRISKHGTAGPPLCSRPRYWQCCWFQRSRARIACVIVVLQVGPSGRVTGIDYIREVRPVALARLLPIDPWICDLSSGLSGG